MFFPKLMHLSKIVCVLPALSLLFSMASVQAQTQLPSKAQLFQCMACHGPQGNSLIPTTPSLAAQPKLFIENQLVLIREGLREVPEMSQVVIVREGTREIPQMKSLLHGMQDSELISLAHYFSAQTLTPVNAGPINTARFENGKFMARQALCGTCHLPDYSGRQQIPRLAGQHEAFLFESMKQFRDHAGLGRDTVMSASLHGFKDHELADLAHFLANTK